MFFLIQSPIVLLFVHEVSVSSLWNVCLCSQLHMMHYRADKNRKVTSIINREVGKDKGDIVRNCLNPIRMYFF